MSENIRKLEIEEILEFDFETQGERIEINEYERNEIKDYIINLEQENKQLKETINKATEYTKEHTDKLKTTRVPKIDFDYKELLEILGDKE